jgi:ribonucleoside-diphosphate reductase alpha chain
VLYVSCSYLYETRIISNIKKGVYKMINQKLSNYLQGIMNNRYFSCTEKAEVHLSDAAMAVIEKKYLKGETPEEMFERVASTVAKPLQNQLDSDVYKKVCTLFYNIMATKSFMPNSPTLMNAGRELNQLAACFVVPVHDSMESIFRDAIADMAMIQRTGGGTGFDFSELRPKGAEVSSTNGESSGPVSFMKAFNACTDTIKQGGARRGANMGILRVDHPDILEFIDCKGKPGVMTNFNLSVAITDEFMTAVKEGTTYTLRHGTKAYGELDARMVWHKIAEHAWQTGEPGLVFIDTVNKANTLPQLGDITATNPCGEQPLLPYEACNLGSINLMSCVNEDSNMTYNLNKLAVLTELATLFLDCVIDAGSYPLPQVDTIVKGNRKIGLGVMGFAELCYWRETGYNTADARSCAKTIMETIKNTADSTSNALGEILGNFPNIGLSTFAGTNRRNASVTTIAPTGTISIICDTSYGIEPYFALSYTKRLTDGGELQFVNPYLDKYMENHHFNTQTKEEVRNYVRTHGSLTGFDVQGRRYLADMKETFVTAQDISPDDHIEMQATFQRYTDNAVSKTINFNNNVTPEDIEHAFRRAYLLNCKGVTVYRDGCLESQPMKTASTPTEGAIPEVTTASVPVGARAPLDTPQKRRPKQLSGITKQISTGCGMMLVTVNVDENNNIYEVLMRAGATGGCAAFTDATARLISISLRYGVPLEVIIDQLRSVRCDNFRYQAGKNPELKGKSCADATGAFLQEMLNNKEMAEKASSLSKVDLLNIFMKAKENILNGTPVPEKVNIPVPGVVATSSAWDKKGECPECHKPLQRSEGCMVCPYCGYSKC